MFQLPQRVGVIAVVGVCAMLAGCPQPKPQKPGDVKPAPTAKSARTKPATTRPASAPLGAKALLTFAKLTPKITKPTNPPGARDIPKRAEAPVAEAEVAIARRQYVTAVTLLERAVGFAPGNPRIHRALGMTYAGLLNRGKALDNLRKAVKGAPDDLEVQLLLGRLAAAQEQNAAAILSLRTALMCSEADDANPVVGETLLRLSRLLADEGYDTAALECYGRLSRNIERHARDYASRPILHPIVLRSETLLTQRGQLLLKLHKPKQAVELLAKSRKRDRTSVETATLLLKALLAAKNVPQAIAVFHELAAETSTQGIAGQLAGELCRIAADKSLPLKLWRGRRLRGQYDGNVAAALAGAAQELGAPDDAVTILTELLAVVPDDIVAGRALVTLQAERGKGDVALRVLARLLVRGPAALVGARAGLGELAAAKLPDDFERKFAAGIKGSKPLELAALYYATGELARRRGKDALAADLLEKALKAKKDFLPAFEALADVYVAQRRFDKVDELLERLSDSADDKYRMLVIRGRLQLTRGFVRKAIVDLEKARALNGSDVELLLMLAEAQWQVDDFRKAIDVLAKARRAAPNDVRVFRQWFRICIEASDAERELLPHAKMIAEKLAKAKPGGIETRLMQAELAIVEKNFITAKSLLAKLRAEAPSNKRVQMLTVSLDVESRWQALSAKQRGDLVGNARRFVNADPATNVEATRLLSRALAKAGKREEVPGIWQFLHSKRPGDLRVAVTCAEKLQDAGKYTEAADILQKVVQADPKNYYRLDDLIRLLIRAKRYPDAATRCEEALKLTLPATAASIFRGRLLYLYEQTKAFGKAQKLVDDMILTTGDEARLAMLRVEKIRLHGVAGQIDEAHKYAMGWIQQEPDALAPRLMLIAVLSEAKKHDRAMKLVDAWLKARAGADKDDKILIWCRLSKVRLLMQTDKYAAALKQAEGFLKLTPRDHEQLALKSNCLTELGRHKEAMATMEQAYAIVPDDVQINNNLAYVYVERGINLDKAERLVRKALAGMPDTVAYMDTLAWVFYKQGNIDAAVRQFEQILKRDDLDRQGHPVVFDHAGDAFYRAGKKARAVKLWTRAIALAKKEARASKETQQVLKVGAKKLEAVSAGKPPPVAPLGQGVKDAKEKVPQKPAKKPKPTAAEPIEPAGDRQSR